MPILEVLASLLQRVHKLAAAQTTRRRSMDSHLPVSFDALLAVDLDGTLLRHDDSFADSDVRALALAQRAGFGIIITTGRFPPAALQIADQLGLPLPLVCADGAVIAHTGSALRVSRCFNLRLPGPIGALCRSRGLKLFEFSHDRLFFREQDSDHLLYVARWSEGCARHTRREGQGVVMALGIGEHAACQLAMADAMRLQLGNTSVDLFALAGETWALRFKHARASKGGSLRTIARALGIPRRRTAAIGNDYNDLSLFQAVQRSFAMADAPEPVRRAASFVLSASGATGGGVAEALRSLI